jgi:hypothetical protein
VIPNRLARSPVNHAYELGWAEGWEAALRAIEERGLEKVLAGERALRPVPLTLAFEPAPPPDAER